MAKQISAVLAIIFNEEGKILLSKRFEPAHRPSHDKWQFPGGGIKKGETFIDAVIREVWEEANVEVKLLTHIPIIKNAVVDHIKKVSIKLYGFPAFYLSGTISCKNDPEASEIGWFHYDDIDFPNTLPGTKEFIDDSLIIWKKN